MKLTFRWYGPEDPVTLQHIRQIPGMKGIVTALHDVPVGEVWPYDAILARKQEVESHGLELSVIESVPVHEDIKLGRPTRDRYIANYIETLRNLAKADVRVVCYNFMPVFDWTRSDLSFRLPDGSTTLAFDQAQVEQMNPVRGSLRLPGWDTSYPDGELHRLLRAYEDVSEDKLWDHLTYFVQAVMPEADRLQVKMAIHPDDPPWSIFGLPRIMTNQENLERLTKMYDSPSNGLCICSGSLGADPANNVVEILRYFGERERVNFVHARNIKITGEKAFVESGHLSEDGSIDMYAYIRALSDIDYQGPIRPDHGRMIWGERGRPGYGLYDRALGAAYLNGLWEAVRKARYS
jgi:mannonate dehydratase